MSATTTTVKAKKKKKRVTAGGEVGAPVADQSQPYIV